MLVLGLLLLAGYLAFLIWEKRANDRALRSFRHVVHVSGIRGKTGVCRLLDAHLRGAGYRVFTKTTGSVPACIDTEGEEHLLPRRGLANIGEQLAMIRRASREGAEILILECMAVQPELQRIAQREMVRGDVNVITNVRYDHIFEMGETLEEIAGALAAVIPAGGALFTADGDWFPYFRERCQALGTRAFLCRGEDGEDDNLALARAVGAYLGAPPETFSDHIGACRQDFGARHLYRLEDGRLFVNLFSANDPQSTGLLLERYLPETEGAALLYNNRRDRPDRLLLFARHFFPRFRWGRVLVMGEARGLACRVLRRAGVPAEPAASWQAALAAAGGGPVVGVGNIKGQAADMVAWLERGGEGS